MAGLFWLMFYKEVYIGFGKQNGSEVTVMVTKDFTSINLMVWASLYKIQVSLQLHKQYCVCLSSCYCLVIHIETKATR